MNLRMSVESDVRQLRGYVVVAAIFLIAGIIIGASLQTGPTEYVPLEPEPIGEGGADVTFAVIAGLAGAIVVIIVVGTLIVRKNVYQFHV